MQVLSEQEWTFNLFMTGQDSIEISDILDYMEKGDASLLCGYFEDYPDFGRYFVRVGPSIVSFSTLIDGVEKRSLSRAVTWGTKNELRIYQHRNRTNQAPPLLRLRDESHNIYSLGEVTHVGLHSRLKYTDYLLPDGLPEGHFDVLIGEGVRLIEVPLIYVGSSQEWDDFEAFIGELSIEFLGDV